MATKTNKRKTKGGMATKTNKRKADGGTVPGAKRQKKTMEEKRMEGLDILSAASAVVQHPLLRTEADKRLWEKAKSSCNCIIKNALTFGTSWSGIQQRLIVLDGALQRRPKDMPLIDDLWIQTYCICSIIKNLNSGLCISIKHHLKKYARLMNYSGGVWMVDNIHFPGTKLDILWSIMGRSMKSMKEKHLKRFTMSYLGTKSEKMYCAELKYASAFQIPYLRMVTRLFRESDKKQHTVLACYKNLYNDLLVLRNERMTEGYLAGLAAVEMRDSVQFKCIIKYKAEIRRLHKRLEDNRDWKIVMKGYKGGYGSL